MMDWRKSTYSSIGGENCVETASDAGTVKVRDTVNRADGLLVFGAEAWGAFTASIKAT